MIKPISDAADPDSVARALAAKIDFKDQFILSNEIGIAGGDGLPAPTDYKSTILADNPIWYSRLGEAAGTVAADEIGSLNGLHVNAPVVGSPSLLLSDADLSVEYVAVSNDFTFVGDHDIFTFNNGTIDTPFSLEAWINPTVIGTSLPIMSNTDTNTAGTDQNEWLFQITATGEVLCVLYSGVTGTSHHWVTTTTPILASNSYHVVVSYSGVVNSGLVYVNGVSQAVSYVDIGAYIGMSNTLARFEIASKFRTAGNEGFMNGTIDEPAVYDKVLTPARSLAHYNAGI